MRISCYKKVSFGADEVPTSGELSLSFDDRCRSRGKASTVDGQEVAWFLEQGEFLRQGDFLKADDDRYFSVQAAPEPVTRVSAANPNLLLRVAYHLGNRHVKLQVDEGVLVLQRDHVLDEMIVLLGAQVEHCEIAFQPEDGAYHAHGSHSHADHSHDNHSHDNHSHENQSHGGHSHHE